MEEREPNGTTGVIESASPSTSWDGLRWSCGVMSFIAPPESRQQHPHRDHRPRSRASELYNVCRQRPVGYTRTNLICRYRFPSNGRTSVADQHGKWTEGEQTDSPSALSDSLHLYIPDVRPDVPLIAEHIGDRADAVAIGLICGLVDRSCSRRQRAPIDRIYIRHVQIEHCRHRRIRTVGLAH